MWLVTCEARADFLGDIRGKITVEVDRLHKKDAMIDAPGIAHKYHCQKFGVPVHFKAISARTLK